MKKILFIAAFFLLIFSATSVQAASGCCKIVKETAVYETTASQVVYMTMQSEDCDKQKGPNSEVTFEEGKVASADSKSCEDATGTTGESQPSKPIAPQLQVSLPGFEKFSDVTCDNPEVICEIPWIAEYIKAFYNYGLAIIGILSVIVMMIGGIIRISAGGNNAQISHGNQYIKGSILGIIFAFCSYSILFLLNPNLTILKPINVSYIAKNDLPDNIDFGEENGLTGLEGQLSNIDNSSTSGTSNTNCGCPWEFQRDYSGTKYINESGKRAGDIGSAGCGPVASWVIARCQGKNYTLEQWIQIMGKYKVGAGSNGSYSANMPSAFNGIGLNAQFFDEGSMKSAAKKMDELQAQGKKPMIIIRVQGLKHGAPNCQFTKNGHFIAGFNKTGNSICINDSANRRGYNSRKNADFDQIVRDCAHVNATVVW